MLGGFRAILHMMSQPPGLFNLTGSRFGGTTRLPLRSPSSVQTWTMVLTSKAAEYRANARECEDLAEKTRDSAIRQQLNDIAQKWRHMADHLEKYSL
jgi:hypothetical protein